MWNGEGSYRGFLRDHLKSIGLAFSPENDTASRKSKNPKIVWKDVDPETRLEFIRMRLGGLIDQAMEDFDSDRKIDKGVPKGKKKKKKKKKKKNKPPKWGTNPPVIPVPPSPVIEEPDEEEDPDPVVIVDEEIILTPPDPRPVESHVPPPPIRKRNWDSRVGYFVALSEIKWYDEAPKIRESPFVDLDFSETPKQYLSLKPGNSWQSEWFETGVIRGVNINMIGKHKVNFAKNGDFEV